MSGTEIWNHQSFSPMQMEIILILGMRKVDEELDKYLLVVRIVSAYLSLCLKV